MPLMRTSVLKLQLTRLKPEIESLFYSLSQFRNGSSISVSCFSFSEFCRFRNKRKAQLWFQSEETPRSISKVNSETTKLSYFETVYLSISPTSAPNGYVLSSLKSTLAVEIEKSKFLSLRVPVLCTSRLTEGRLSFGFEIRN